MKKAAIVFFVLLSIVFYVSDAFGDSSNIPTDDDVIAATFSVLAYDPWQQPSVPLPAGWDYFVQLPDSLNNNGYYGVSFKHCYKDDNAAIMCDIVIAHRGTTFSVSDIYDDFLLVIGKAPYDYFTNAKAYYDIVSAAAEQLVESGAIDGFRIGNTGHSLGAIMAEMFGPGCYHENYDYQTSMPIVFDSPGSLPIINDFINKKIFDHSCLNSHGKYFFSAANAINTVNEQLPSSQESTDNMFTYFFDHEKFDLALEIGVPGHLYFFDHFSVNQHHIINFYNQMINKISANSVEGWPIGFEAAYKHYLTYDYYKNYWDSYILAEWDEHPSLHLLYNFSDYDAAFIKALEDDAANSVSVSDEASDGASINDYTQFEENGTRPTLEQVISNNFDGRAAQRRKIYDSASDDKKLYYAVLFGDTKLAEELLQNSNADVNSQHGEGNFSLLQIAIMYGYLDMVKLLVKYHVDANLSDNSGNSALSTVARERYGDAAEYTKAILLLQNQKQMPAHAALNFEQ